MCWELPKIVLIMVFFTEPWGRSYDRPRANIPWENVGIAPPGDRPVLGPSITSGSWQISPISEHDHVGSPVSFKNGSGPDSKRCAHEQEPFSL